MERQREIERGEERGEGRVERGRGRERERAERGNGEGGGDRKGDEIIPTSLSTAQLLHTVSHVKTIT